MQLSDEILGVMDEIHTDVENGYVLLRGWSIVREDSDIQGRRILAVRGGEKCRLFEPFVTERPDVAASFGREEYLRAGFLCYVDLDDIAPGEKAQIYAGCFSENRIDVKELCQISNKDY